MLTDSGDDIQAQLKLVASLRTLSTAAIVPMIFTVPAEKGEVKASICSK